MAQTNQTGTGKSKAGRTPAVAPPSDQAAPLAKARTAALWVIACAVALADIVSLAESYRGLRLWAEHHQLPGVPALVFPLMVDVFIVVGELSVFVLVLDSALERARQADDRLHKVRHRLPGWCLTIIGLGASVAGNMGDVWHSSVWTRGTHAVPPVAAALALWVGLGVLKRIAASYRPAPIADPATATRAPASRVRALPATTPARRAGHITPDAEQSARRAIADTLAAGQRPIAREIARQHLGSEGSRNVVGRWIKEAMNGPAVANA